MKRIAALALCAMLLGACAVKEEPAEDDGGRAPDFQGLVVKEAQPRAGVKVVLIERGGRNSCTDQFLVTITARSRLLRESATGRLEVHPDSVCVGDRLKVWFAGGVAESCPPQTTAEGDHRLDVAPCTPRYARERGSALRARGKAGTT